MTEVKLFGAWASPFSRRVEMGLKLKGVKYEFIEEDLSDKSSLLLKYNPIYKKVPLLLHNDYPVAESLIILEYIDEKWDGPSLLPKDPHQKAMARFWSNFLDHKCWPAMRTAARTTGEEQKKAMDNVNELFKLLDSELKGKRYFGGDTIGLVDIAANLLAYWFGFIVELVGLQIQDESKFPNLCRWADEYINCSFVKENMPPKDKFIKQYTAMIQTATASK